MYRIIFPLLAFAGTLLTLSGHTQVKKNFPALAAQDTALFGTGVQRTMTLLATSTPQKRNTVKILFYGQSITKQDWWKAVADDLRTRFPNADLIIENKAVGGFALPVLSRPAEHDLFPLYPDLVIFHVYGGEPDYEAFITDIRRRTTAEIALQSDHVTWLPDGSESEGDDRLKGYHWHENHSQTWLPTLAQRLHLEMMEIRAPWKRYLTDHHLEPKNLLSDGVHLNEPGNFLLAELVKPHLVYRPELPTDGWRDTVKTYEIGKDIRWQNGKLTLNFEGNRVDIIAAPADTARTRTAQVRIDGKKPSAFPELYAITRPNGIVKGDWPWTIPGVIRVDHEKPLVLEDWTLTITEINADASKFRYSVRGSKTGPDGEGRSEEKFVSKSGRVVLSPGDWWLHNAYNLLKTNIPIGTEINWSVVPLFVDTYRPPKITDPTRETVTTLAQGLTNAAHRLEIQNETPFRAIRVYRPPVR